jgi:DNA-binding transcriptional ArsR family regulator
MVPKFLLDDDHLSIYAKLVLSLLDEYRNKVTGQCNPRIARIASNLKVSERTIYRALAELRKWGLVAVERCRYTCQYLLAARDQWLALLRKTCGPAVEIPTPPRHAPGPPDAIESAALEAESSPVSLSGQTCLSVRSGPPLSINEPTQGTYLSTNEGDAVPRSVAHVDARAREKAAAAPPPVSIHKVFLNQGEPLRSPFTLKLCETLLKVHPQPGLPVKALVKLDAILRDGSDTAARCAKTIEIRHAQWIEYWNTLEPGKFIPQLWRWLEDRDWMQVPVIRKPARRAFESSGERIERIFREMEERDQEAGLV